MLRRNPGQASRLRNWSTLLAGALALLVGADVGTLAQDKTKTDVNGEPLPAGALARMGTLRWRHADTISYVAFTPDGKAVLTASQDSVIRLWERASGKEIRRFEMKEAVPLPQVGRPVGVPGWNVQGRRFAKVAMSDDGKVVAAVLANNAVQLWDVNTGKEIRQLKGPQFGINTLVFAPDAKSLAVRGADQTTFLLETETGKEIHQIKRKQPAGGVRIVAIGGGGAASGLAFSPDGKTIASAEFEFNMQKVNAYVKLTDTKTGNEIRQIDTTGSGTSGIAYSPDGKILALASGNLIHLREADTAKEIRQIKMPQGATALAFAPDSKTLAVKGRDQLIRLLETNTGKTIHELGDAPALPNVNVNVAFVGFGASADTRDFAFAHDGKVLASGGGQVLRFWTVATGKEQPLAGGHRGAVSAVTLTADGKTLLSRGADNTVRRWDAATGQELGQFTEPKGTIGAAFSLDGKTVALANIDGAIRLHASADGKVLHQLKRHTNGAAGLAFSPDGKTLASRGNVDKTIRLYDVAKGTELKEITLPGANQPGAINPFGGYGGPSGQGLVFSPDGRTLAANINNQQLNRLAVQPAPVGASSTLHLWDVATGKEIRQISLPAGRAAGALAFSPDGRILATENLDQTVSLCELASGRERAVFGQPVATSGQPMMAGGGFVRIGGYGQPQKVYTTLAFSPDGGILVSRGPDHAVRVWEVDFAKEIAAFKGHAGEVQAVSIAPDGKSLASGSADTTILVWDLASLKREPKAPIVPLQPKEVEALWSDLIGGDAVQAGKSSLALRSAPKQVVSFLGEHLKPAAAFEPKKIERWVADLDSSNFKTRTKALAELENLGELALPALQKVLISNPTLETRRRVEPLLEKLTTGVLSAEQVRLVRAVDVLEKIGSTEARQLLETLAQGAPGALMTRQAQMALHNLAKQRGGSR